MSESSTFIALLREAKLAAEMLSSGVTTLRVASTTNIALFSRAFFDLSIGMERVTKLIIILDYYIDNGCSFPTDDYLKKTLGHDLQKLFDKVEEISRNRSFGYQWPFTPASDIPHAIISVLRDFARTTRYYNLDFLQKRGLGTKSPEMAWFDEVGKRILSKHYTKKQRQAAELLERQIGPLMNSVIDTMHLGAGFRTITSASELMSHEHRTQIIQKHAQVYVLQINRYLTETLWSLQKLAQSKQPEDIPLFIEIFAPFYNSDRYFKRRKTWQAM